MMCGRTRWSSSKSDTWKAQGTQIKMMPFGAGRRICPGIGLAMLHLEYFVANLVREFEWKATDGEVDLSEKLDFTVVMENPLMACVVKWKKQVED